MTVRDHRTWTESTGVDLASCDGSGGNGSAWLLARCGGRGGQGDRVGLRHSRGGLESCGAAGLDQDNLRLGLDGVRRGGGQDVDGPGHGVHGLGAAGLTAGSGGTGTIPVTVVAVAGWMSQTCVPCQSCWQMLEVE